MNIPLEEYYDKHIEDGALLDNPSQRFSLLNIQHFLQKWMYPSFPFIYIWGTVGSGKSTMTDIIYNHYPRYKIRYHYSDFVTFISNEVLHKISKSFSWYEFVKTTFKRGQLLYIDEWVIEDITQAMMWKDLIPALMKRKVYVIITTNLKPTDIYLNGHGRAHISDLINTIAHKALVVELSQPFDFRNQSQLTPLTFNDNRSLEKIFDSVSQGERKKGTGPIKYSSKSVLWLDFNLCIHPPVWRHDYMSWSNDFKVVIIEGVKSVSSNKNLLANWVRFVDILYDNNNSVYCSYNDSIQSVLEQDVKLPLRTRSRLKSWLFVQQQFYSNLGETH